VVSFFDDFGISDALNIGSTVVSAGASLLGASKQADAANKAAANSTAFQNRIYNEALNDRVIAEQAGFQLADMLGTARPTFASFLPKVPDSVAGLPDDVLASIPAMTQGGGFESSPGYQFRLNEGLDALDSRLAAQGLRNSGARQEAITEYAQGAASADFNDQFNRLQALRGGSQANVSSANGLAGGALADANQSTLAAGTARASGFTGAANALNNFAGNLAFAQALRN
jgi:hypothetical protein